MAETIITDQQEFYIREVAQEVIDQFTNIANAAQEKLGGVYGDRENPMINAGFDTGIYATKSLNTARAVNAQSYKALLSEPSIARVVVRGESDTRTTYYICRTTAITGRNIKLLASYRSVVGRLAALELGDEIDLPKVGLVEVIERTKLRPIKALQGWDSEHSVFEADLGNEIFTIDSLRALLIQETALEEQIDDGLLDKFFADESKKTHQNIHQGIQRSVIEKMGLRDQPILDRIQDEIFRLPINQQLLLLGPPGTGKTTTLIRRLGQKLDIDHLSKAEKSLIESQSEHASSWLMFTPTTLLKHYLKEAFAREGVPASDQRVVTWDDYRRELGRNALGVLKTTTGSGIYTLKDSLGNLQTCTQSDPVSWYEEFERYQEEDFLKNLSSAAENIKKSSVKSARDFSQKMLSVISNTKDIFSILEQLLGERNRVQQILENLSTEADQKIKGMANLQLNRDKTFPDQLAAFINEHDAVSENEDDDEDLDDAADEEDSENISGIVDGRAALNKYMQVLRAHARATANNKRINKNTLNAKLIDWLGDRNFDEENRLTLGSNLIDQSHLRKFSNPINTYLNRIPHRYRSFRRTKTQENRWYIEKTFKSSDLHPLELDIILLTFLRVARKLYARKNVQRNLANLSWDALSIIVERFKNQILVDEAADFSPIQLACMAALANPKIDSFIACGDFNQRLTTWGARTVDQMTWVVPSIRVEQINVTYRQSRQLNELANKLMQISGEHDKAAELPKNINSEGVSPALLEGASELDTVTDWLAARIVEIEVALNKFPSVAIFVNSEEEVLTLTENLSPKLEEHNLRVIACQKGQSVGQDNDVRVFDIQHIKGLEFEAAFYVGIDELAKYHPELFDKYLYVGVTRAATYLGVTCHNAFPEKLEEIKGLFQSGWGLG